MANKDLWHKPHSLGEIWWYETSAGIEIYFTVQERIDCRLIPWRSIRAALARKDKK